MSKKTLSETTETRKAPGLRLKELRLSRKLTLRELAQRIGVHPTYLLRAEKGVHGLSTGVIERVAAELSDSEAERQLIQNELIVRSSNLTGELADIVSKYLATQWSKIKQMDRAGAAQHQTPSQADSSLDDDDISTAPSVRAYSLGKTTVKIISSEEAEVQWSSEKAKELFFYLLVRGDWARKEEIIDALWPEVDPSKGDTLFWTTTHRLRRGLYQDCLVREGSFYRLNSDGAFWLDAREFEDLLQDSFRNNIDEEEKADRTQRALDLYKGAFLGEVYSDWSEDVRNRLQDRYLSAIITLARTWLDKGAASRAAELCDRALDVDHYQEEAYFIKMQALALAGQVPEAYGAFRKYSQVVVQELGSSPNERIVELNRQISQGKLSLATTFH